MFVHRRTENGLTLETLASYRKQRPRADLPELNYALYSDEGLTSETSVSIRSFLRCRIYIFITKL